MKPILFNTDMVRAILDGRKTVTRRVVKPRYRDGEHGFQILTHKDGRFAGVEVIDENEFPTRWLAPPYQPGDILYVRETWAKSMAGTYIYKSTDTPLILDRWRPSIHMPKDAARLFLRVTDVRVERLCHIGRTDALKEGANTACAVLNFKSIWDSTIKPADRAKYGWDVNPWVWVISFERISREDAQKGGEG